MLVKLVFGGVISFTALGNAQQSPGVPKNTGPQYDREQIAILKAQLDVMKDFNQEILDIAFWTIGIAGGIVTLLVGVSWFANWKIYDRDKAALTQELRGLLQQELSAAKQTLQEESAKRSEEIASELRGELDHKIDTVNIHIADLRLDILESEARRWTADKVYANAIRQYMLMVSLAVAQKSDWRISLYLGYLNDSLDRVISEPVSRPDVELARQLVEVLDKLPASYSLEVSRLKAKLSTARG